MYGKLQTVSTSLIRQFGLPCVIVRQGKGNYDATTGKHHIYENRFNAHCLFDTLAFDFPSSKNDSSKGSSVTVKQGDVMLYLTNKADVGDKVEADGEIWHIVKVQPIKPAGVALLYQCQGRK